MRTTISIILLLVLVLLLSCTSGGRTRVISEKKPSKKPEKKAEEKIDDKNKIVEKINSLKIAKLGKATLLIESIRKKIDASKRKSGRMEVEQQAYVREHPRSAVQKFKEAVDKNNEVYRKINKKLKELEALVKSANITLDDDLDLDKLINDATELENLAADYVNEVMKKHNQQIETIKQQPDLTLSIYFRGGRYKEPYLDNSETRKLTRFLMKIQNLHKSFAFMAEKKEELTLFFHITGYTDGQGYKKVTKKEILSACGITTGASDEQTHKCLSELRAKEIYKMLLKRNELRGYKNDKKIIGMGSVLAKGSKTENKYIRKADISFALLSKNKY